MTQEEFVEGIRIAVHQSAVSSVCTSLTKPAGRRPASDLIEQSTWYNKLESSDRAFVDKIIERASSAAVFGFFCALDGARAVHDADTLGRFELSFAPSDGSPKQVLIGSECENLHDLF